MKVRVPSFYKKFHCIASACTDTCCAGWEVDVDEASQAHYASVPGDFGQKLRSSIEDGHFVLAEKERCPFLNSQNLCEIYLHLGKDSLCDICREHPRFIDVFGDWKELGVGLCCEESVRLLLESEGAFSCEEFLDSEEPEVLDEESLDARNSAYAMRAELLERLSNRQIPLSERLADILRLTASFSEESPEPFFEDPFEIETHQTEILLQGESLGAEWDFAKMQIQQSLKNGPVKKIQSLFSDSDGEKIIAYQIFRYFLKSLYDGDMLSKVKFAIYFWLVLKSFGKELSLPLAKPSPAICAVKLLSKQLEYSEQNMEILETEFRENAYFSIGAFLKLLGETG